MKINDKGLAIIKKWERCRLQAYRCPAGVWTIGWGHTRNVCPGDKITMQVADFLLKADLIIFEKALENFKLKLNENQFSALVSLIYNIGPGNFAKSPVYRLIRLNPNSAKIKDAFLYHVWANGSHDGKDNDKDGLIDEPGEVQKLPGLESRRLDEISLYFKPI